MYETIIILFQIVKYLYKPNNYKQYKDTKYKRTFHTKLILYVTITQSIKWHTNSVTFIIFRSSSHINKINSSPVSRLVFKYLQSHLNTPTSNLLVEAWNVYLQKTGTKWLQWWSQEKSGLKWHNNKTCTYNVQDHAEVEGGVQFSTGYDTNCLLECWHEVRFPFLFWLN